MTDSLTISDEVGYEQELNIAANVSVVSFSTIGSTVELINTLSELISTHLKGYELGKRVSIEEIPISEEDSRQWLTYCTFIPVGKLAETLIIFSDLAANLSVNADEKYGFPKGTFFYGSSVEVLHNGAQSKASNIEQSHTLQSHFLSTTFSHSTMLNGLRARIASLEQLAEKQHTEINHLYDHLRGNAVMNFEYRGMHNVPSILYAIIEHIGADEIKKKFESIVEEEYPGLHRLH